MTGSMVSTAADCIGPIDSLSSTALRGAVSPSMSFSTADRAMVGRTVTCSPATTSTSVSLKTSVPIREVDPGFVEVEVGVLRVERLV